MIPWYSRFGCALVVIVILFSSSRILLSQTSHSANMRSLLFTPLLTPEHMHVHTHAALMQTHLSTHIFVQCVCDVM